MKKNVSASVLGVIKCGEESDRGLQGSYTCGYNCMIIGLIPSPVFMSQGFLMMAELQIWEVKHAVII